MLELSSLVRPLFGRDTGGLRRGSPGTGRLATSRGFEHDTATPGIGASEYARLYRGSNIGIPFPGCLVGAAILLPSAGRAPLAIGSKLRHPELWIPCQEARAVLLCRQLFFDIPRGRKILS